MDVPPPLRDALQRLERLFPSSLAGVSPPPSSTWSDDGLVTTVLEGAMQRCGWMLLQERWAVRLGSLREEAAQPFESVRETLNLQCRAFNEVMDEFDRARREAILRSQRRLGAAGE